MKHSIITLLLITIFSSLAIPAFAEDLPLPAIEIFPTEVRQSESEGISRIEKVYSLTKDENPDSVPKEDFISNGTTYTFLELLKNDLSESNSKIHTETVTINTDTNNTQKVLAKFAKEIEVATEDRYTGLLQIDHTTIQINAAGYGNKTYPINETRSYPNLSDADTSLVPKSINKDGSTLNLTNIKWETSASENIDGLELTVRFTAVATYSGTGSQSYVKGYTATAVYTGEVIKTTCDMVCYTAVFTGTATPQPQVENPLLNYWWWCLPVLGLIGGGYGIFTFIRKRKRGY